MDISLPKSGPVQHGPGRDIPAQNDGKHRSASAGSDAAGSGRRPGPAATQPVPPATTLPATDRGCFPALRAGARATAGALGLLSTRSRIAEAGRTGQWERELRAVGRTIVNSCHLQEVHRLLAGARAPAVAWTALLEGTLSEGREHAAWYRSYVVSFFNDAIRDATQLDETAPNAAEGVVRAMVCRERAPWDRWKEGWDGWASKARPLLVLARRITAPTGSTWRLNRPGSPPQELRAHHDHLLDLAFAAAWDDRQRRAPATSTAAPEDDAVRRLDFALGEAMAYRGTTMEGSNHVLAAALRFSDAELNRSKLIQALLRQDLTWFVRPLPYGGEVHRVEDLFSLMVRDPIAGLAAGAEARTERALLWMLEATRTVPRRRALIDLIVTALRSVPDELAPARAAALEKVWHRLTLEERWSTRQLRDDPLRERQLALDAAPDQTSGPSVSLQRRQLGVAARLTLQPHRNLTDFQRDADRADTLINQVVGGYPHEAARSRALLELFTLLRVQTEVSPPEPEEAATAAGLGGVGAWGAWDAAGAVGAMGAMRAAGAMGAMGAAGATGAKASREAAVARETGEEEESADPTPARRDRPQADHKYGRPTETTLKLFGKPVTPAAGARPAASQAPAASATPGPLTRTASAANSGHASSAPAPVRIHPAPPRAAAGTARSNTPEPAFRSGTSAPASATD